MTITDTADLYGNSCLERIINDAPGKNPTVGLQYFLFSAKQIVDTGGVCREFCVSMKMWQTACTHKRCYDAYFGTSGPTRSFKNRGTSKFLGSILCGKATQDGSTHIRCTVFQHSAALCCLSWLHQCSRHTAGTQRLPAREELQPPSASRGGDTSRLREGANCQRGEAVWRVCCSAHTQHGEWKVRKQYCTVVLW